jgi:flavin-dependent dehydrogenase
MTYDVIVVGARCAGAPTAMLLARRGHKVLLVDADRFPSDMPLSTHLVWQSGAACLARWGLLERINASGCPPVRHCEVDLGPVVLAGEPPAAEGVADAYSPRRVILDKLLVDAAVEAGAELREGFVVTGLLPEGEAVGGVRGRYGDEIVEETARVVVGADGRNSRVAELVQAARYNTRPSLQGTYFAYWQDVPLQGLEFYVRPRRGIYAWPTTDGLVLVGVNWTAEDFGPVKADVAHNYQEVIVAHAPRLARWLSEGSRVGRFIGGSIANFMREPCGSGWALVGDAGVTVDPCTAAGINNAFRDAELLADALDDGLSRRRPMQEALADYHARRDMATTPIYEFACQLAPFAPPPPEMAALFGALAGNQAEINRFLGVFAQTVSPAEFFSPESIGRIMGGRPS